MLISNVIDIQITKRIAKRSTDEKQELETLMQIESKLNLKSEAIVSESTTGMEVLRHSSQTLNPQLLINREYIAREVEFNKQTH